MNRSYTKLGILDFGQQLIESSDLDPVYVALHEANLQEDQLMRWLVAYWCFYDAGVASWMSERHGRNFWNEMLVAAANEVPNPMGERWRRGAERRHFRGEAAVECVRLLTNRYQMPEDMVLYCSLEDRYPITGGTPVKSPCCREVMRRVKSHHLFGDWISFKAADMIERVLNVVVEFDGAEMLMFASPREGALLAYDHLRLVGAEGDDAKRSAAVNCLIQSFSHLRAPPRRDRPINVQEVETVLCKWKSHVNGHYPLNHDVDELASTLVPWAASCRTAGRLYGVLCQALARS